jgi:D-psicose/D-tagatose/L-ribulose 3-epimerase
MIKYINHPGCKYIAGDLYHMLVEESHISGTILDYADDMITVHLADTNRRALGLGILDLDLVIMALYTIGYNDNECFCTPEPLGPGGDPYPQMFGKPEPEILDNLVQQTASYFYEREEIILSANETDLLR